MVLYYWFLVPWSKAKLLLSWKIRFLDAVVQMKDFFLICKTVLCSILFLYLANFQKKVYFAAQLWSWRREGSLRKPSERRNIFFCNYYVKRQSSSKSTGMNCRFRGTRMRGHMYSVANPSSVHDRIKQILNRGYILAPHLCPFSQTTTFCISRLKHSRVQWKTGHADSKLWCHIKT